MVTDETTVKWGNRRSPFEKTVEIEYYNTLTHFILRVKSTRAIANVLMDDESIKDFDGTIEAGTWQDFTIDLDEGDTQTFSLKVAGSGPPAYFEVNYTLLGECVTGCGEVTFTYNGSPVTYGTVLRDYSSNDEPHNIGTRCWLDRNLGATKVATSSTDAQAYGDYFTFSNAANACPDDFRLATEAEWNAERLSWINNNATGAIESPLKLTMAGFRSGGGGLVDGGGSLSNDGTDGLYWSGTVVDGTPLSLFLLFNSSSAFMSSGERASGLSVRCIKN